MTTEHQSNSAVESSDVQLVHAYSLFVVVVVPVRNTYRDGFYFYFCLTLVNKYVQYIIICLSTNNRERASIFVFASFAYYLVTLAFVFS